MGIGCLLARQTKTRQTTYYWRLEVGWVGLRCVGFRVGLGCVALGSLHGLELSWVELGWVELSWVDFVEWS